MKADDIQGRLALDARALNDLRTAAKNNPREGMKAAAQQFEAYFLQMVMKSMRDASPQDGLFDSDQTRMYTSLLDQQMSQSLSGKGALGFAKLIEEQLSRNLPREGPGGAEHLLTPAGEAAGAARAVPASPALPAIPARPATGTAALPAVPATPAAPAASAASPEVAADAAGPAAGVATPATPATAEAAVDALVALAADWDEQTPRDFVSRMWPHAVEAARSLGVPPHFLVAHAALETGWGRHEPKLADGSPSFNLFGVKAGRRWQGSTVDAMTTEFVNGVATSSRERFRAYGSYGESFRDYAALLSGNPRFAPVLGVTDGMEFARKLQQTGYATDPMYADKLARIIHGTTLRQALFG